MFDPAHREDYVDYLESEGQWEEAAKQLGICVNDEDFLSPHVRNQRALASTFCAVLGLFKAKTQHLTDGAPLE